jgi:aldehyde:ferredoxin oxidoreductase
MRMLYSEVRGADPLSPMNKLYISTGPLAAPASPWVLDSTYLGNRLRPG